MRKPFALSLCILLVLVQPMTALAVSEGSGFVGPEIGIGMSLVIVAMLIALDTILGILKGIKLKDFHWDLLPQFLATGVLPYLGGLVVLAGMAYFIAEPFRAMFYAAAAAIAAKYISDVWDKLRFLFGAAPGAPEI